MDTNTTKRPKKLTQSERKAWDHIVQEMKSRGIDCDSRVMLIKDYVKLEARIERLSDREQDPVFGSVQTSRALNVAIAERRRLHTALFAGAPTPEQLPTLSAKPIRHGQIFSRDGMPGGTAVRKIVPSERRS